MAVSEISPWLHNQIFDIFESCRRAGSFTNREKFLSFLEQASFVVLVWENESHLVSVALEIDVGSPKYPGFECHLEYVMTHPDMHGRGGGRSAVAALLASAKSRGILAAHLTCGPHLVDYYASMGFRETHRNTIE